MKKTVLVVGPWARTGGVHTFMRNLCIHSNLNETWNMKRFDLSRPPKKTMDNNQYNFLTSNPTRMIKSLGVTSRNFLRFPFHAKNSDVLQLQASDHYAFWEPMLYAQIAKIQGRPVVMRFGGSFDKFYESSTPTQQEAIKKALQIPDRLVVLSHWWKDIFGQFVDPQKIHVIPNAVPTPPPMPKRESRTGKPIVLFICGSEAKRKGIDAMLELVKKLHHKTHFLFVAVTDQLKTWITEQGLAEHIEMHGEQTRKDMKDIFYPRADIFMLPSFGEGFPNSMLEAMAAGLPTITTPVGSIPEVLIPHEHGFINDPTDVASFHRDLEYLVDHPKERIQMGRNAYKMVCDEYNLNTVFATYNQLWNEAIAEFSRK